MNQQPETRTGGDRLAGTWSVYDVTATLKDRDAAGVRQALAGLDRGGRDLSGLAAGAAGAPAIAVEIQPGGVMKMDIRRSLRPDLPATMTIRAVMQWSLEGDRLTTRPNPRDLSVEVRLDKDAGLAGGPLDEAKRKAAGIEAGALQGMRGDPLWNNANAVTILHAGPRTFLTKAAAGNLMLHVRKGGKND